MSSLTITMGTAASGVSASAVTAAGTGEAVDASTGAAFFVSPTGSDSTGNGTSSAPWASIQKFIDTDPVPGSTLYLRGGTYDPATQGGWTGMETHGNLIGTAEAPITIRNYPGEVPSFPGATGITIWFAPNATSNTMGANYVVLDGLEFPSGAIDNEATIVLGGQELTYRLVQNITLRNLRMGLAAGTNSTAHCIGIIYNVDNTIVEDCTFVGPGITGPTGGGSAVTVYTTASNQPAARNTTIRRCVVKDFRNPAAAGIMIWEVQTTRILTVAVDHCTFIGNGTADGCNAIDYRYHSTASVTNCAFDVASGISALYDPYDSALTTLSHNFYSQVFDSNYYLTDGQTGRSAASDGTDAGALDW
jgi:hypothetical protein